MYTFGFYSESHEIIQGYCKSVANNHRTTTYITECITSDDMDDIDMFYESYKLLYPDAEFVGEIEGFPYIARHYNDGQLLNIPDGVRFNNEEELQAIIGSL